MKANRSMPPTTVIPVLAYPDLDDAVAWLHDAFGFELRWQVGDHRAQLWAGDGCLAITGVGDGAPRGGSVMVRVPDVDAHHARAAGHGARITEPPTDFPYGERQYSAIDPGGHAWTFSQTIADVAPEDWGGRSARLD